MKTELTYSLIGHPSGPFLNSIPCIPPGSSFAFGLLLPLILCPPSFYRDDKLGVVKDVGTGLYSTRVDRSPS